MSGETATQTASREPNLRDRAFRERVMRIRERAIMVQVIVRDWFEWADHSPYAAVGGSTEGSETARAFADCSIQATHILLSETTSENGIHGEWADALPRLGEAARELSIRAQEAIECMWSLVGRLELSGELSREDFFHQIGDIDSKIMVQISPALMSDALWCARMEREREREETRNSSAYRMQRSRKRRAAGYQSYRAELHDDDLRALRSAGLLVGDLSDKVAVEVAIDSLLRAAIASIPVVGEEEEVKSRGVSAPERGGAAMRNSMLFRTMLERMAGLVEMDKPS